MGWGLLGPSRTTGLTLPSQTKGVARPPRHPIAGNKPKLRLHISTFSTLGSVPLMLTGTALPVAKPRGTRWLIKVPPRTEGDGITLHG